MCLESAEMDGHLARSSASHSLRRAATTAFAVLALGGGMAACSDDDPPPVVSEEQYRESIADACDRHMPTLLEAWDDLRAAPFSDAELAAFYRSEMVPRQRSILRSVRNAGLPPIDAAATGINDAAEALQEIEDETAAVIDRRRDGTFLEGENPWINLNAALDTAGIECAMESSNWEP